MYLQKVKSQKMGNFFFVAVTKRAGSRDRSRSERYGSPDLDPYQNVTNPQYRYFHIFFISLSIYQIIPELVNLAEIPI
jgi:hypothetical protein